MSRHRLIALTCSLVLALVCLPVLASQASDIDSSKEEKKTYPLYDGIRLASAIKFLYGKSYVVIKSVYPQLECDYFDEPVDDFNQTINDFIETKAGEFKANVDENRDMQKKLPKSIMKNNLYIDFASSYVQSGKIPILSIRFNVQGYIAGMAHPYHHYYTLNYDLENGQTLELSDLFEPESNYLEVLSSYTNEALHRRHLSSTEFIQQGTAPKPENFKNWNVKPAGILITFDEYQVAPYVDGAQAVLIPYSVLSDIIPKASALAGCTIYKRKCVRSNVVTGGFIDEASNSPFIDPRYRTLNPILSRR